MSGSSEHPNIPPLEELQRTLEELQGWLAGVGACLRKAHVCSERLSLALGTLPADPARRAALNERVASVAQDAPIRRISRNANEVRPLSDEVRPRSRSRNRLQR